MYTNILFTSKSTIIRQKKVYLIEQIFELVRYKLESHKVTEVQLFDFLYDLNEDELKGRLDRLHNMMSYNSPVNIVFNPNRF